MRNPGRPVKLPVETTSGLEVTQDSDQELDKTLFNQPNSDI